MIWLEIALKAAACISATVATLRAGSRAWYILDHGAIGIMDGPLILPSFNETNPLFELSEAFRHSVRLSIFPQYYDNVRIAQPVPPNVEPYPISPLAYLAKGTVNEDTHIDHEIDALINESEGKSLESYRDSWLQHQTKLIKETLLWVPFSVKATLDRTRDYFSVAPKLISYWIMKSWGTFSGTDESESDYREFGR